MSNQFLVTNTPTMKTIMELPDQMWDLLDPQYTIVYLITWSGRIFTMMVEKDNTTNKHMFTAQEWSLFYKENKFEGRAFLHFIHESYQTFYVTAYNFCGVERWVYQGEPFERVLTKITTEITSKNYSLTPNRRFFHDLKLTSPRNIIIECGGEYIQATLGTSFSVKGQHWRNMLERYNVHKGCYVVITKLREEGRYGCNIFNPYGLLLVGENKYRTKLPEFYFCGIVNADGNPLMHQFEEERVFHKPLMDLAEYYDEYPVKYVSEITKIKEPMGCVVLAKIVGVLINEGWFYFSCLKCGKRSEKRFSVVNGVGEYDCSECGIISHVERKVRTVIRVQDITGYSSFVLFERHLTKILNTTSAWINDIMKNGHPNILPHKFEKIIDKLVVFKIAVSTFNIGSQNEDVGFTVHRLTDDYQVIESIQKKMHQLALASEVEDMNVDLIDSTPTSKSNAEKRKFASGMEEDSFDNSTSKKPR